MIMKEIILDTDIGIDCDDAVALALLIKLAKVKKCKFDTVVTSTSREGAAACVRAVAGYYNYKIPNIGKMARALECDKKNTYAKAVMQKYGYDDGCETSVAVLRKKLAAAKNKIAFVTIGPLSTLADFLQSGGDDISALTGQQLFDNKISELYMMAGCFPQPGKTFYYQEKHPVRTEWNVVQDIPAAQYVMERVKCRVIMSPFEVGSKIFTGNVLKKEKNNPVWYSLECFAKNELNLEDTLSFARESWDPVTCYVAAEGIKAPFSLSKPGKVAVEKDGFTSFAKADGGKHYYLTVAKEGYYKEIENTINGIIAL